MRLGKGVFYAAAIYGFVTLPPLYFLERLLVPAPNHPEFYYGFIGAALAFQVLFLIIGRDPARLRPAIPACLVEKLTFVAAVAWLWSAGRVAMPLPVLAGIDLVWATLFAIVYVRSADAPGPSATA